MNDTAPPAHLIYLRSGRVIISRKRYADWREIQDEYEDYMTSLGPFSEDGLLEFLSNAYGDESRWFFTAHEIRVFMNSNAAVLKSR
ncbi:MAG TPA: hypothetical protein VIP46_05205 [Pyrinomonadaceae bacterium]